MPMTEHRFRSLGPHGFHSVAFTEWATSGSKSVVVCVHGLTRNGRDFDFLAQSIQDRWRVVCPDVAGRGRSNWLSDPTDYAYPQYMTDMAVLMAHRRAEWVDWIGTSMGGLIGMMLASQPNTPIRSLVVNDIGPFIPKKALQRIAGYVALNPRFPDRAAVESYLREVHKPFGPLTHDQWSHLARYSAHPTDEGTWRLHYDPKIGHAFRGKAIEEDIDLWPVWDRITCPVLILRGGDSDLLSDETARQMLGRGPSAELVEFPGIGHAPALMDPMQIAALRNWLTKWL